jgi:hypothetical protein
MRPWLVFLGAAFVLVGASAFGSLWLLPPPSVDQQATSQLDGHFTPQATVVSDSVPAANASHGTLTLHWTASVPVAVRLTIACAGGAPACGSPPLASWAANLSGTYTFTGPLHWQYVLTWATPPTSSGTFSFSTSATWAVVSPPSIAILIAELASGLLAGVGVVALFLGLFLRGGYQRPPKPVSRTADDASEVAGVTDPRTERSGDGSGRPPPGPPSRSA